MCQRVDKDAATSSDYNSMAAVQFTICFSVSLSSVYKCLPEQGMMNNDFYGKYMNNVLLTLKTFTGNIQIVFWLESVQKHPD